MSASGQTAYEVFEASSEQARRLLRQEELILDVTEKILEQVEEEGLSQSEIASRLGTTQGYVSQLLTGQRNMTLRTLASLADAANCRAVIQICSNRIRDARVVVHPAAKRWKQKSFGVTRSEIAFRRDPGALRKIG